MTISHCLGAALRRLSKMPRAEHDAEIAKLPDTCSHNDCTTGMGCRAYVASMAGSEFEKKRRECEARDWLRRGYTSNAKVNDLMERIASKRGRAAADELRQDMREQWKRRSEWLWEAK